MSVIHKGVPEAAAGASTAASRKLGDGRLTALVLGSMVGSGVFSLPQKRPAGADARAIIPIPLISQPIMIARAFVYKALAVHKPALDSDPYAYAKAGFGDFIGFNSAWGYGLSAWLRNVSHAAILVSAEAYRSQGDHNARHR